MQVDGPGVTALPTEIEDAIWALAEGPTRDFANGVAALCARHPELRGQIEAVAALCGMPGEPSPAGDLGRVKPTPAEELMAKLAGGPRLDHGRYEVEGVAGIGGMGKVLRIRDRTLNRRLAMKVRHARGQPVDDGERRLQEALQRRFLEEAQVQSQLDHPGVPAVHELGLDAQGVPCFTMRLVVGHTAAEVFQWARAGREGWTITRTLEVILKVCDTMGYAHERGVLHRDLKPSNVMVGRFGEVYVTDWGLAKLVGQAEGDWAARDSSKDAGIQATHTLPGERPGTAFFMSPEQARGEALDARTDVYAVGAMLYVLLTGRRPYDDGSDESSARVLAAVRQGPPKRIEEIERGVAAELVAIVEKAMAFDREQRYPAMPELAGDLRAYLDQRAVRAYRTGPLVELRLWVRRNRQLAVSLAGLVLAVGLGTVGTATYASRLSDRLQRFDYLAAAMTQKELLGEERNLLHGRPDQRQLLDEWVNRAHQVLAKRTELESIVSELRSELAGGDQDDADRYLATSIENLLSGMPELETRLLAMTRARRWSHEVKKLTLAHPRAPVTWDEARAAITRADGTTASRLYRDIQLDDENVWGLVPIGMNPSGLWEFYDLRSAWDGQSDPASLEIPRYEAGDLKKPAAMGIVFVLVPGGTLPRGKPPQHSGDDPRLTVPLDAFFIGKYEVTIAQWLRLGGRPIPASDPDLPVDHVTWGECVELLDVHGLVLPSELQWEYAYRGTTTTAWWTGDVEADFLAAENILAGTSVLRVGSKRPNPFGLFDMGGNVWEWCIDEPSAFGTERAGDGRRPSGITKDNNRIKRGGAYDTNVSFGAALGRDPSPESSLAALGMRAVRALAPD